MEYSDNEYGSDSELIDDILGPEDLFNDEAEEGGNDAPSDGESEGKIKKEEDTSEKVEKKVRARRVARSTKVTLNVDTLKGMNGLSALKKLFSDFKFKGSGCEKEDLTKIIGILQQWMCYKLCPTYEFESCMLQLEALGKKKVVQTLMKKYRMGIDDWGEKKSDDEDNALAENNMEVSEDINRDAFDVLLDTEIANADSDNDLSQNDDVPGQTNVTQNVQETEFTLTPEQIERIARNRKLAEERRLQRLSTQHQPMEVNEEPTRMDNEISLEKINLEEINQ